MTGEGGVTSEGGGEGGGDTLPDRLSNNPKSPFFNAELLARGVGVRFRGVERHNVEEYCISGGWVRVAVGNTRDRFGQPLTLRLTGTVEVYIRADEA